MRLPYNYAAKYHKLRRKMIEYSNAVVHSYLSTTTESYQSRHRPHVHTTVIINHLLKISGNQTQFLHITNNFQFSSKRLRMQKKWSKKETDNNTSYLYLSVLNHGLICPFTAQSSILLKILIMRLHIKFMLNFAFHCNPA